VKFEVLHIAALGSFGQTNDCPTALDPGTYGTVSIPFSPRVLGVESGVLTITDSTPDTPTSTISSIGYRNQQRGGDGVRYTIDLPGHAFGMSIPVKVNCHGRVVRCTPTPDQAGQDVAIVTDDYFFECSRVGCLDDSTGHCHVFYFGEGLKHEAIVGDGYCSVQI
jgi:hypothetical protein